MFSAHIQTQEFFIPLKDVPKKQLGRILNLKFSILSNVPLNSVNYDEECPESLRDYCSCLSDVCDFFRNSSQIPAICYPNIFTMIEANMSRQIPIRNFNQPLVEADEDDEPFFDPCWFYLQHLYDLFSQLLEDHAVSLSFLEQLITERLLVKLLKAFNNQDVRERDFLRFLLHKIYAKFVRIRLFVRKSIGNIFINFSYSNEAFYGIAELLVVLSSIINGFALPLKEIHKDYLEQQIMPLHKPNQLACYFKQLSNCVVQFIQKDSRLSSMVITTLFKYWPKGNSFKEIIFLSELDEILYNTKHGDLTSVMETFFVKMGFIFKSPHFQVAERGLLFFNNEFFLKLVVENSSLAIPIFLGNIQVSLHHWNILIRPLASSVNDMLRKIDKDLFEKCLEEHLKEEETVGNERGNNQIKWEMLERMARQSPLYQKYNNH